jgi:hypothetical protein
VPCTCAEAFVVRDLDLRFGDRRGKGTQRVPVALRLLAVDREDGIVVSLPQ